MTDPIHSGDDRREGARSQALRFALAAVLLLGALPRLVGGSPAPIGPPADLDTFVEQVREAFEVPGIAVAIVEREQVFARGYGVRKLGKPAAVDAHTLFGIGSNTKAFTTTALALLVEEGKLGWDDRVIDHLPSFQLSDPYVTREITIRDMVTHRTGFGLGAGDLLWWPPSTYDRKQIARRIRALPLENGFRSQFGYSNVLYLVAGEVIEAVSGLTWEEFVESRIVSKVGMEDSSVRLSDVGRHPNSAATHARIGGEVRPIAPFDSDNTNPAGGVSSSALDMGKWLRVHLASGRLPDGAALFSPETAKELTSLVTPRPIYEPPEGLEALQANFNGYALGFTVRDYRGQKVVGHGGGLPGYVSMVSMLPELGLGVVVLTNQESGAALSAITYHVLDFYLRADGADWLEALREDEARNNRETAKAGPEVEQSTDSASGPSLALADYAGLYRDAWYGDISIESTEGGGLVMRFAHSPSLVGELEHWQHDTFVVRWFDRELRADAFVTFALRPDGSIEQAKMEAVSEATDFSFDFHDLLLKPVESAKSR